MYTDISALRLGTVLMQPDARGKNRAIAYASRTLTPAESNYSVTQETLAVVWALKTFSAYYLWLSYNGIHGPRSCHRAFQR